MPFTGMFSSFVCSEIGTLRVFATHRRCLLRQSIHLHRSDAAWILLRYCVRYRRLQGCVLGADRPFRLKAQGRLTPQIR